MAKKELNDDLFAGGSISDSEKTKKSDKSAKNKKKAEKLAAKRRKCEDEIKKLKDEIHAETDDNKKAALRKDLERAKDRLDSVEKGFYLDKQQKKIIKIVVAVVVILAVLVTYVATGLVRKGPTHALLQLTTSVTGMTVESKDGEKAKIPVSTYNYYFANTYNNLRSTQELYAQYGIDTSQMGLDVDFSKSLSKQKTKDDNGEVITWQEKLENQVVEQIKTTYSYYLEAVKANGGTEPAITEEQQKELDDTLAEYNKSASEYGFTLSAYLVKAMGKGVTESVFRTETTRSYIAENYRNQLTEKQENEEVVVTDEDVNKYKDENIEEFNSVDVRIFEAVDEATAKKFKEELKADGSNFTDLCVKYAEEGFSKDHFKDAGASTLTNTTKDGFKNLGFAIANADKNSKDGEETYSGLDWLFSADRKAGDINQVSTTVVYMLTPARLSDVQTVNVRHILIGPASAKEDPSKATTAPQNEWDDAYKKAEELLNKFNSGKKTEDEFAALAKANSSDTGSAENGGLYENVAPNQMVDTFNSWCFDANRKSGDVGIVKTQFGYHIIYFVGTTGVPAWQSVAKEKLTEEKENAAINAVEESYTSHVSWIGSRYFEKDVDIDR